MEIGYYKRVTNLKKDQVTTVDKVLEDIKNGKWQDETFTIRLIKDKKERNLEKEKLLPALTLSGLFHSRFDNQIEKHSGFIGIDLDDCENPEELKEKLKNDPYIYAIFVSVSGNGLCCIFKINPKKHRENFYSISKYLLDKYNIVSDPTSINESRIRYVSYDPNIYVNLNNVKEFDIIYELPKKEKITDVIFSQEDFENLLNQVVTQGIDICDSYYNWVRVGFAFAHQFGEAGRQYFHDVSKISSNYNKGRISCDMQYNACLRGNNSNVTTISTFYYFCKQQGLKIYSDKTKKVSRSVKHGSKVGLSIETIKDNLKKFEGIEISEQELQKIARKPDIVVFDDIVSETEYWIKQNYKLERNLITRYIENDGKSMNQEDYNSIFIKCKKVIEKIPYDLIDRLINSDFVPSYSPLIKFIENNRHLNRTGNIEKLFKSIETDKPAIAHKYGKKWLVGIIASIYGQHSPLMLVLSGPKQNTGKTEFFRRLLPGPLKKYYAESKLDEGKDADILMTQKILIMDDEMGGKNKKESKRLKEQLSKQIFTVREPYGKRSVELTRLAVLAGTTNETEILFDPTGNRRILPIHVESIDHEAYNKIDKGELFMEAVRLYESGFKWELSFADIKELGENTGAFEATSLEAELLEKYFSHGHEMLTATEIKIIIEYRSNQKISLDRLCKELKHKDFKQTRRVIEGHSKRLYLMKDLQVIQDTGKPNMF